MFEKLESVAQRSEELTKLLGDPAVLADREMLRRYAKEQADLRPVVTAYQEYRKLQQELRDNQELLDSEAQDSEFAALIKEEVAALTARAEKSKMPGVNRFETEVQSEEGRRLKNADRDVKYEKQFDK